MLDEFMNQFRIAGRELFNAYFRLNDPYSRSEQAWDLHRAFGEVQQVLFWALVSDRVPLSRIPYGQLQPGIRARVRFGAFTAALVNREISSGYWDHPIREIDQSVAILFLSYFDWDQLGYRDNQYVRGEIKEWTCHPELVGKHVLVESKDVTFEVPQEFE